ncbi:hypothetical protein SEA_BROPLEASE_75 [Streptomyces phage BroPlease]|nr:hypothetical protein SEA_BROPLEASE_75 [Streptomyces phage BroPlease]
MSTYLSPASFGMIQATHEPCGWCGGFECLGPARDLPDGTHIHYCRVNEAAGLRTLGSCTPTGEVCPGCCESCPVVPQDPATWDECTHQNNPPCDLHLAEYEREAGLAYLSDLRADYEAEVWAAATMDAHLYD